MVETTTLDRALEIQPAQTSGSKQLLSPSPPTACEHHTDLVQSLMFICGSNRAPAGQFKLQKNIFEQRHTSNLRKHLLLTSV